MAKQTTGRKVKAARKPAESSGSKRAVRRKTAKTATGAKPAKNKSVKAAKTAKRATRAKTAAPKKRTKSATTSTARKTAVKAKPAASGKPAAKKTKAKTGSRSPAGKAAPGKAKAAGKTVKKTVKKAARKPSARRGAAGGSSARKAAKTVSGASKKLSARDRRELKAMLLAMHDHFVSQINSLKNHSLERVDPIDLMEDGTDAFDRQFALSVAGSEQETVAEIDNALRRLEEGVYGVCEGCGCLVGRERLWALPFTRLCVKCQSEAERMRPRYRPFGN